MDSSWRQHCKNDVRKISRSNPPAESLKSVSRERELGSENGLQIWIANDVSIAKITLEKFLVPTPPVESQKCVSRERKLDRKTDSKCG